jgi:hypothetical protein
MKQCLLSPIRLHDMLLICVVGQFHLYPSPGLSLGAMVDTVVLGAVKSCLLDTRTHQRGMPPPLLLQDRRLSAKMEATCSSEASVFVHLTMPQNKLQATFFGLYDEAIQRQWREDFELPLSKNTATVRFQDIAPQLP